MAQEQGGGQTGIPRSRRRAQARRTAPGTAEPVLAPDGAEVEGEGAQRGRDETADGELDPMVQSTRPPFPAVAGELHWMGELPFVVPFCYLVSLAWF